MPWLALLLGCSNTTNFDVEVVLLDDALLDYAFVTLRVEGLRGGPAMISRGEAESTNIDMWFGTNVADPGETFLAFAWLHDDETSTRWPGADDPISDEIWISGDRSVRGNTSVLSIALPEVP